MNKWVLVTLVLTVFLILGFFLTYSQVQSISASSGQPEIASGCAGSGQAVTTENAVGIVNCGTFITTQTAVSTEVAGGCSTLNLYATTESANGNINCARVNQGFNQTGLTLYTQIDEGQSNKIYDLSGEGVVGIANNQSSVNWLQDSSCIFQQFCWLNNATSKNYITLGHDYNDSGNNQITMCSWFFPTVTSGSSPYVFGDLLVFRGYSLNTNNAGNSIRAQRDTTTGTSTTITVSTWNFACISYTFFSVSSNWVSLFLNGKLVSTFNDSTSIPNSGIGNYTIGNTPKGISANSNFFGGRDSAFYQFNYPLSNSSVLALYEYVPNPTEQSPVIWNQLLGFPSNCPANQYVVGITTTLSCSSASNSNYLTTQTSAFFSYGTCPANQFATAITTTTLNCAAVSTEAVASCATGQFATTESANGGFGCGNPNINFQNNSNTCTDTTATTVLMAGFKLSYTAGGTGQVYVTIDWKLSTPATSSINTQFRIAFGTGTAPNCNAAVTGTKVGNEMEVGTFAAVASFETISLTVGVLTLTPGTTYWFDIQMFDSTGASWIYSLPQMAVMES